jgi:hypothetical protein
MTSACCASPRVESYELAAPRGGLAKVIRCMGCGAHGRDWVAEPKPPPPPQGSTPADVHWRGLSPSYWPGHPRDTTGLRPWEVRLHERGTRP